MHLKIIINNQYMIFDSLATVQILKKKMIRLNFIRDKIRIFFVKN